MPLVSFAWVRTSSSPPRISHLLSLARWRTLLRNSFRRLSRASSRFCTTGLGRGLRFAYLKGPGVVVEDPFIGEDCVPRKRGRAFASRGESGGEDDVRIGLEERGDEMVGRYGEEAASPWKENCSGGCFVTNMMSLR